MAIKFGDSLENQNANYPIVDLVANHAKGVLYVDAFENANLAAIPLAKRAQGSVVIIKSTGLAYVFTGTTLTDGNGWNNIGSANWVPLGEATQTTNLTVQIPAGQSFGKYVNGNVITVGAGGWNALEIIRDAITGFIQPTVLATGNLTSVVYSLSAINNQSHTVSFSVKNNNQSSVQATGNAFKIKDIKIYRRNVSSSPGTTIGNYTLVTTISSGTAYDAINAVLPSGTQPSAQNFSYTDTINIPAQTVGITTSLNYYYMVIATPYDGAGVEVTAADTAIISNQSDTNNSLFINVADYVAPSASLTISRTSGTAITGYVNKSGTAISITSTSTARMIGDYGSSLSFSIANNNSAIPITSYFIERQLNGGSWSTLVSTTAYTSSPVTYTDNSLAATTTYDSIAYRINLISAYGTTSALGSGSLSFLYPAFVGKLSKDNLPTTAAQSSGVQVLTGAGNVAITGTDITGLSIRKTLVTGSIVHQITDVSAGSISVTTANNEFVYVCIPVDYGASTTATSEITNINKQNEANTITAWSTSDPAHATVGVVDNAYTNTTVSVTNAMGHIRNYYVYRTNANNAYSSASNLFIY